jgi:hypothetical protein
VSHPSGRPVWFVGELDDPWVIAIADALAGGTVRLDGDSDWPETILRQLSAPATLVLHRAVLTSHDAERLARLRRDRTAPLRVLLVIGPHARYADLQRWSNLVDLILPEATARETIGRHLRETKPPDQLVSEPSRPRVAVVSSNFELRATLADACLAAGYPAQALADWPGGDAAGLVVWDVPLLEPDWSRQLSRHARTNPLVALLGFADRAVVREAREQGASACLELPCEPADLVDVLDRLASSRPDRLHGVPPAPLSLKRGVRQVAEPGSDSYN